MVMAGGTGGRGDGAIVVITREEGLREGCR